MNEQGGKRRDWIKNAVIVFLVIMLVLTFFSNTIMNYSLPEVSAQYVSSGSIQAKVRGSGVVTAGDPYSVKTDASRTILSVAVRNGDHVEKGDVLFYLEAGDSTELKQAQRKLEELLDAYRLKALDANISPETTNKILNGEFTDFNTYYVKAQNLKKEIKTLEDHIAVYEKEIAKVEAEKKDAQNQMGNASVEKRLAWEQAAAELKAAKQAYTDALTAAAVADVAAAEAKKTQAQEEVLQAEQEIAAIQSEEAYKKAELMLSGYENALKAAQTAWEEAIASNKTAEEIAKAEADYDTAKANLDAHLTAMQGFEQALSTAESKKAAAQTALNLANDVISADTAVAAATKAEAKAKKEYTAEGPDYTVAISQYDTVIKRNQEYVDEQKDKMAAKQTELTELLTQMTQESSMEAELLAIADQRELIEKLSGGSDEGAIVAPITGTVGNISLTAGNSTTPDSEVATIFPDGKGFTMEITVTKEQAQRLNKGDVADIQNSWYYSNVTAVLQQIKVDKKDPANSKVLVFAVEGDVSDGQNLSISIGQKSANYDYIVPNSAIREDNNGKFILKVSQKSSPLGNRYYAERVDVEVLASDDTQSAIRGALEGWEFVITTSTKPVEAGQLVRLPD